MAIKSAQFIAKLAQTERPRDQEREREGGGTFMHGTTCHQRWRSRLSGRRRAPELQLAGASAKASAGALTGNEPSRNLDEPKLSERTRTDTESRGEEK